MCFRWRMTQRGGETGTGAGAGVLSRTGSLMTGAEEKGTEEKGRRGGVHLFMAWPAFSACHARETLIPDGQTNRDSRPFPGAAIRERAVDQRDPAPPGWQEVRKPGRPRKNK